MTATTRALGLGVLGLALVAGCGTASSDPGGSGSTTTSSAPPSTTSTSTSTSTSTTTPSSPTATTTTAAGDVTLQGTVSGDGLTCVGFRATNGKRYALAGPGLPGKLVSVAHSFGRRTSLSSAPGAAQIATVTIVGHPVQGAMSTCSATVFSVTSAQIHSVKGK